MPKRAIFGLVLGQKTKKIFNIKIKVKESYVDVAILELLFYKKKILWLVFLYICGII